MKHEFSLTSPLYHVIITNRVNKAFMKGDTTAGVFFRERFFYYTVKLKGEKSSPRPKGLGFYSVKLKEDVWKSTESTQSCRREQRYLII